MLIKEVKVRDLPGFVNSKEFIELDIKPITKLRAVSQFNNPDADPDDPALIYAVNNGELLGFAGLLPRYINDEKIRVFSNSCWWAHPKKGKGVAIPLFFKLIEKAGFSLYLSESPPRVKSILEKTGLFGPLKKNTGIRGFLRFYFADIFSKRFKNFSWLARLIVPLDTALNTLFAPMRFYYLKKFNKHSFEFESVSAIDKTLEAFIKNHSKSELIQKTPESFDWFMNYPWIKVNTGEESFIYPFTHQVKKFELDYFVLKKQNEIKAFVVIANRDNLSKIPYIYFNSNDIRRVYYSVMKIILMKKYDSLVVFHPGIVEFINQNKIPFFYRKREAKYSGVTKQIYKYFEQKSVIQDGDGDVVFI